MGSILQDHCTAGNPPTGGEHPRALEVYVVFTGIPGTLSALRTAAQLAQGLRSRIRLLLVEAVPFSREIDSPQRDVGFLGRQFRTLVDSYATETFSRSVETDAEILLCRDVFDALQLRLPANSVVVIGTRNRWWPIWEDRLAKRLRAAGHHLVRTSAARAPSLRQFDWRVRANA